MKRKRHGPAAALTAEPAMLYRCGTRGKRYKTKHGAYMAEAARIFYAAYPDGRWQAIVTRVRDSGAFDDPGEAGRIVIQDLERRRRQARGLDERIIRRLARFLRWRDGRRAALELTTEALLDELAQRLNMQRPEAVELMRLAEQELV